ncbi:MAG: insulinase family protein [Chloroflexi bacterium]|nr:insulinase family protein [Chloroflexota bacterium]
MTFPNMPLISRTEVDGVPTVWSPAPGPLTAALVVRIGRADERPIDGGITHLVEHLAMAPLGQPRYEHNAFVEGNRTVFFASGSPAEVTAFLDSVTRSLAELPLDRLDMEREILKREAQGRDDSAIEVHRHLRFGFAGHGLIGQPEFGLARLDADRIAGWSRYAFTRGNSALWLTGEPPGSLRLHLRDGPRRDGPPVTQIPDVALPAYVEGDIPGFGLGYLAPRRTGAGTFASIFHQRLRKRLRLDLGLVYEVLGSYEPLDAGHALGMIGTDCDDGQVDVVADVAFEELRSLLEGGATDTELGDELADLEAALNDPTAVAGLLDMMVSDDIFGRPPRSPEERYEEQRLTSAGDVATRAAEVRSSAILMASTDHRPDDFRPYPTSSAGAVAGREIKPLMSMLGLGRRQRLMIGPDGVSLRASDGTLTTIRYADCVVLERPADDEIVMWDRDGDRLYIPAIFWRGGSALLEEITAALPQDIVIHDRISVDLID